MIMKLIMMIPFKIKTITTIIIKIIITMKQWPKITTLLVK